MNLDSAVIYTNDVQISAEFYQKLGLKPVNLKGQDFATLAFGNDVRLSIKKSTEPRECPGCQTVFISADNIEEVFANVQKQKLDIRKPLEERPWGKEFSVWDPDMNKVTFIRRSDQAAQ